MLCELLRVVEKHIGRGIIFAHLRSNSPGKRKLMPGFLACGKSHNIDRCAVIASLYLPQAALVDNARHSPSALGCFFLHIQKTASTAKAILAVLSMGYEKDIFAVFAYEFELSPYDLYSSSTPSSKTASNSSSPRPSMMSLKRSIAMPIESVACFCFSLASKTSAIRLL